MGANTIGENSVGENLVSKRYTDEEAIERLKYLKRKGEELNNREIRIKTLFETMTKDLEAEKARAVELFGTDDIDELKVQLLRRRELNSSAVEQYEKKINLAETSIDEMEASLSL